MATTGYDVTTAAFLDCGSTPCFVEVKGDDVAIVLDNTQPVATVPDFHTISGSQDPFMNIQLAGLRVWARALGNAVRVVVSR